MRLITHAREIDAIDAEEAERDKEENEIRLLVSQQILGFVLSFAEDVDVEGVGSLREGVTKLLVLLLIALFLICTLKSNVNFSFNFSSELSVCEISLKSMSSTIS